ncbi:MAG: DUF1566 domain-containing protein [Candidatus Binatia bacterium]
MRYLVHAVIGLMVLGGWGSATLALSPRETCEADKLKRAGLYGVCRLKAESAAVKAGGAAAYDRCDAKFIGRWQAAEARADDQCPSRGDLGNVAEFIRAHTDALTAALGGAPLPSCALELTTCHADLDRVLAESEQRAHALVDCQSSVVAGQMALGQCRGDLGTCAVDLATCGAGLTTCGADLAQRDAALATCAADLAACRAGCGNGVIDAGEQCDGNALGGASCTSQGFAGGTVACDPGTCGLDTGACWSARLVDNGDGTVTDHGSGLTWEKQVARDGNPVAGNRHDGDNTYVWAGTCAVGGGLCQPTAAAAAACHAGVEGADKGCDTCTQGACTVSSLAVTTTWQWLVDLNSGAFAGHSDWRLPTRAELETIVDYSRIVPAAPGAFRGQFCGSPTCTDLADPLCSCTANGGYWSASSYAGTPTSAWYVNFYDGFVNVFAKSNDAFVRAVR